MKADYFGKEHGFRNAETAPASMKPASRIGDITGLSVKGWLNAGTAIIDSGGEEMSVWTTLIVGLVIGFILGTCVTHDPKTRGKRLKNWNPPEESNGEDVSR